MEVLQVTPTQYAIVIKSPHFIYASNEFNDLNSYKCKSVHYLLLKDTHYLMGIIGGIRNKIFLSPFSAPYGGFTFLRKDIRLTYIDGALDCFLDWVKNKNLSGIYITLPPFYFSESQLSKSINCLFRKSFKLAKIDLNYYLNLEKFNEDYINQIWKEARNNLKQSFLNQLTFNYCESFEEKTVAYDIIRQNKEAKGYPLYLTFDQVIQTSKIVDCDFFLVREDTHAHPIAAAVVFHVSCEIVQVIYWGDLLEYRNLKPMNFLSYKIFEFYKKQGKKIVDLGPSTEDSVPNFGLCVFKESIGCEITPKYSFSIRF
jgi:hypothetical protein